jgi:hypothetical protein
MRAMTTADVFYEDKIRQWSPEADFGVHWSYDEAYTNEAIYPIVLIDPPLRIKVSEPRWRISYVKHTGEIYAVEQIGANLHRLDILGIVPIDDVDETGDHRKRDQLYYRTVERILSGWSADVQDVSWAIDKIQRYQEVRADIPW